MFTTFVELWNGIASFFVSLIGQLQGLFWVEATTGSNAVSAHPTFIGSLAIISVGLGLAYGAIRMIRSFIAMRG